MGIHKETHRNQKQNMRRKQSEYALQLQEKQKLKFIYGVLEKQFHKYFLMADKAQGITGEVAAAAGAPSRTMWCSASAMPITRREADS